MRIALLSVAAALATFVFTLPARADMGIGGISRPGQTGVPLRIFAPGVNGTAAASFEMGGPLTGLTDTQWVTYEPNERLLYVSDYNGGAIRVFPVFAAGNIAPLRVLNPPLLAGTRANAPVFAHGELGAIASACCIATYALNASGDTVSPLRLIRWGGGADPTTRLNNPNSLTYLPDTDEYAVNDYEPGTNASRIIFHARTSDNWTAPTRMITGSGVAGAVGIAHDRRRRLLFVLGTTRLADASTIGRIAVFADNASGDAAPLYTIGGNATQLNRPAGHYYVGIAHDPYLRRIMVSTGTSQSTTSTHRVVIFRDDAVNNAIRVGDLSGDTLGPGYIGAPFAVPSWDVIYRNGFEAPTAD